MKEPVFPSHLARPDYVVPLSKVLEFCISAETLLETPYRPDGDSVSDRMQELMMLYPSSCAAITSAEWHRDTLLKDVIESMMRKAAQNDEEAIRAFKTPSIVKELANARCADINALLTLTIRLNSSITHSLDALRSVLSNLKAERQMMGYANS